MSLYLGIDTSNYTTSCALYDSEKGIVIQQKKLLPVKMGELGLRQSDAVFHHTVQLPELISKLFSDNKSIISAVGVSDAPRRAEGSYMPCFLVGVNAATAVSAAMNKPLYKFSHQQGHIMAALYSSNRMNLYGNEFLAFHVSGGTTELLHVKDKLDAKMIATSLDLKAGQAVDRVGVMLGFPFPAGKYVDELAVKSEKKYKINIKLKDGNCSLSGLENKCKKMFSDGESKEDICRFCIDYIMASLMEMSLWAKDNYGNLPLIFSGGVMSNSIISRELTEKLGADFAKPDFSADNAAGTAILACYEDEKI